MGLRDIGRTLLPGNDRALAAQLRQEEKDRRKRQEAERAATIQAMSERDKQRTPQEVADSNARGRRSKRSPVQQPPPGINP